MTRSQIVDQIKHQCTHEYLKITDWVHDIHHVQRVVANGRKLAIAEKLSNKDATLVEIACWLHDLGRVGEVTGLEMLKSNHAEVSYQMSKLILKPYQKQLGLEGIFKILQAVREHNLPSLKHPDNKIAQLLVDADRGAGINVVGIYTMLSYLQVIQTGPVYTKKLAYQMLPELALKIKASGKSELAVQKLNYFKDWYYGNDHQAVSGQKVAPLHTPSAKKLFKKGMEEVEEFINELMLNTK